MDKAMVEAINEREPAFLARDGKGKGYVCPQCGSGSGPKGTGLHRDPGAPTHWKCFACGGYFDVLDLYGLAFGLETFPEKLAGAAAYYGLTVSAPPRARPRPSRTAPPSSRPRRRAWRRRIIRSGAGCPPRPAPGSIWGMTPRGATPRRRRPCRPRPG